MGGVAVLSLKKQLDRPAADRRGAVPGARRKVFPTSLKSFIPQCWPQQDCRVCLHQNFTRSCFHERNRAMLDHASALVCYYDGQPGGTAYTVDLARKRV